MFDVDKLIDKYAPAEGEFTVTLPKGDEFRFKAVVSYEQILELGKGANEFLRKVRAEKPLKAFEPLIPFLPADDQTIRDIYMLNATNTDKQLSQLALFKLAQKAGCVYALILAAWNNHQMVRRNEAEDAAIDDLKKD